MDGMNTNDMATRAPSRGVRLYQLPTGSYATRAALAFRGGSFREERAFAATAVLVRHPRGDLLVDAGFGARAEDHVRSLPAFRRSRHVLGRTASDQLDEAGYDRRDLAGVLLTHSHWDHVSGLDSLRVPVWITAEERRYAAAARADRVFATVAADHPIHEYGFDGPPHLGFPASHDVHGDGAVVVVPAPGHTSGSVVVFVTTSQDVRYAFVGDLAWQLEGVERGVDRPWLMRTLADSDAGQVRADLRRVMALEPGVRVVPAHDARAYEGIAPLLAADGRPAQRFEQ
jgi:N-acyl homoserine lactone hydrolase